MALALHPTQERVTLHGVTWATFECLLADRDDHASVRIAYDQGTMELTMPSAEHETVKQFLALIVDAIALARNLHLLNVGSTPSRVRVSVDAPDDLLRILTEQ